MMVYKPQTDTPTKREKDIKKEKRELEYFKCIALIKIFLWCAVFSGLQLHTHMHIYIYIYIYIYKVVYDIY